MPSIRFGAWRSFYSQWYRVEPQKGKWDFAVVDREVAWANDHGVQVTLMIGFPATWASARPTSPGWFSAAPKGSTAEPAKMDDWKEYVRTLATRYKGKVEAFEQWNEPNNFFSGQVSQLVAMNREAYSIIKSVDPAYKVISPPVSLGGLGYLDRYLAAGGASTFDILGVHFYVSPKPPDRTPQAPENILPRVQEVKAIMAKYRLSDKPLWDTETGWAIANASGPSAGEGETFIGRPLNDFESSAFVARAYLLSWPAGLERFYWYAWGTSGMSLVEPSQHSPKGAAKVYEQIEKWLVGSTMRACTTDSQQTWICTLQLANGQSACAIWNAHTKTSVPVPKSCPANHYLDLEGESHPLTSRGSISIDAAPILLGGK